MLFTVTTKKATRKNPAHTAVICIAHEAARCFFCIWSNVPPVPFETLRLCQQQRPSVLLQDRRYRPQRRRQEKALLYRYLKTMVSLRADPDRPNAPPGTSQRSRMIANYIWRRTSMTNAAFSASFSSEMCSITSSAWAAKAGLPSSMPAMCNVCNPWAAVQ